MTTGPREFGEGPLHQVATVVHWFLVVEVLIVLAIAPGALLAFLLSPDPSNLPLFALAAVPLGPAVAAAFFAWRQFLADRDAAPTREFRRGYRLNLADSLRVWVPALLALLVLAMNVAYSGATGLAFPLVALYVVLGAAVVLWAVRMLAITSTFAFRWRDAARIAVFTLATQPLRTLGLLSLVLLVAGLLVVTFDAVVVLLASILTFVVLRNELPVLDSVRERFVAG